jgi:hypothetical protein
MDDRGKAHLAPRGHAHSPSGSADSQGNVGGQRPKHKLATEDSVMEPRVLDVLKECLMSGEQPRVLLEHLSDNYIGYAQMVNLLVEWHTLLGDDEKTLEREVRGHLRSIILRDFDVRIHPRLGNILFCASSIIRLTLSAVSQPKVADSIFQKAGSPPHWLGEMVKNPEWRDLIYELSEMHPNCMLMGYAMGLISQVRAKCFFFTSQSVILLSSHHIKNFGVARVYGFARVIFCFS